MTGICCYQPNGEGFISLLLHSTLPDFGVRSRLELAYLYYTGMGFEGVVVFSEWNFIKVTDND